MTLVALLVISLISFSICLIPPETWQEDWFDHNQLLTRHYYDDHVAIYFDKDVDKSITWLNKFLHDLWVYVKKTYGEFGDDPHLYAIFHARRYHGSHTSTHFNADKKYRSAVDYGRHAENAWTTDEEIDIIVYQVSLLVESSNHGIHHSIMWEICGNQWTEIFIYDVYVALGRDEDANRWYDAKIKTAHNSPRPQTYWFRDWFYPIYEQYGGAKVLNGFFELWEKYFPRANTDTLNRPKYTRSFTFGEFVHFWNGATKVNLKGMAREVFGWNDTYEMEYQKAREDFPNITYYNIIL